MRSIRLRLTPLLLLLVVPLVARAATHDVVFSLVSGGPAPAGSVTFADPEPVDGSASSTGFSFDDGTSTWTQGVDTIIDFNDGVWVAGTLTVVAIKVEDVDTGRGLVLYSDGSWESCASLDVSGECEALPGATGTYVIEQVCPPGMFDDGGTCVLCPIGTYQPDGGQMACLVCAPGSFAASTGSLFCELCPEGTAQAAAGSASCDACAPGFYQDEIGALTCKACDAGTFQPASGQTACFSCPGGAATPCSDNGTCDDGAGTGICTCDEGFDGAACDQISVAGIGVTPKKLIVVDKLTAAGKAKVVYVSKDQAAGITKGTGTDTAQIDVRFDVAYANASAAGAFVLPAGASDGTSGWLVNKETVAKYVNKSAPSGDTQAKVAVIKPDKLLKIVGKGLGDVPLDIFGAGNPGGAVETAYCVTNAGQSFCHCSTFTGCAYKLIAGDTGAKLVCKTGSGDPTCAAAP